MLVKTFVKPPIDNNNYLVIDETSCEAALIDCSSYTVFDDIRPLLNEHNAKLKYILLTHGHFDHVAGLRPLSTKVVMHNNDLKLLKSVNTYLPSFGMPDITIPEIDIFIKDNDIIHLGNNDIKVIHTPGHTQGGVCYYIDGMLFSGDTIFRESVGRCDLDDGDFNQIVESIKNKIYTLPDNTIIYPGHGKDTTVGWEKLHNRFL